MCCCRSPLNSADEAGSKVCCVKHGARQGKGPCVLKRLKILQGSGSKGRVRGSKSARKRFALSSGKDLSCACQYKMGRGRDEGAQGRPYRRTRWLSMDVKKNRAVRAGLV